MSRKTSTDELYKTIGALVKKATGRDWWRKAQIQSRPAGPYATIYITEGMGLEHQVVESIEIDPPTPDEVFTQTPWGAGQFDVVIEFLKTNRAANDSALQAATRFKQALYIEERFWDLWEICGLIGGVRLIDVSALFREDTEPRADIRFSIIANLADPGPLVEADIYDIKSQEIDIIHIRQDGEETPIVVDITTP